jgi:hypothetical protein
MAEGAAEFIEVKVLKEFDESRRVFFLGNATVFETPMLEAHYQRQVFSVFVSKLTPNTEYTFSLRSHIGSVGGGEGDHPTVYRFKTPSSENLSLVAGGDAGNTRDAKRIISRILETNPDIIVIGGDVAYDNGMYSCACVWDEFLSTISPSQGGLIPLSFAVGNHDMVTMTTTAALLPGLAPLATCPTPFSPNHSSLLGSHFKLIPETKNLLNRYLFASELPIACIPLRVS